jgi:hypothetical protein
LLITTLWFVGSFDELAVLGYRARLRRGAAQLGVLRAWSARNPLSDEELARKFDDNAVRSLPEERAAELAARTPALPDAQSVEDLTVLLTSAGER